MLPVNEMVGPGEPV